jgi:septal ring factor EnvC (AmiA/AmiB activator)
MTNENHERAMMIISSLRLTNEGLVGMHTRAVEAADLANAESASARKLAATLADELANVRAELAEAQTEIQGAHVERYNMRNRLDKVIEEQAANARNLHERLCDEKTRRAATEGAWSEAFRLLASALVSTAAASTGRGEK